MPIRSQNAIAAAAVAMAIAGPMPALAITMQECSAKYKAAQSAGTLKGMKWNDFRKAECATDAAKAAPVAREATTSTKRAAPAPTPEYAANTVFPRAVSPRYANETAGKARMHTCLDQYRTNKAGNVNGGLKWIEKGGGYYSECNKRLRSQ